MRRPGRGGRAGRRSRLGRCGGRYFRSGVRVPVGDVRWERVDIGGMTYAKDHVVAHYAVDFETLVWLYAYSGNAHAEVVAGVRAMLSGSFVSGLKGTFNSRLILR